MKLKLWSFNLLVLAILWTTSCSNAIRTQLKQELPGYTEDTVIIKPGAAVFIFKIPPKDTWSWHQESTPRNQMEYTWSVAFALDNTQYECGYKLFKHPAARPDKGSLKELLNAGQFDLWEKTTSSPKQIEGNRYALSVSGRRVDYARIETMVASGSLAILLREKDVVEEFIQFRPDSLTLTSKSPDQAYSRKRVKIDYQM